RTEKAGAGENLIHAIVAGVIGNVVPAEEHLPRRTAVNVNERRAARGPARGFEELAVNLDAVARLEDDLLRHDELRGREIGRNPILGEPPRRTTIDRLHGRKRRTPRVGSDIDGEAAVRRDRRRPPDARSGGDGGYARSIDRHLEDVPPVDIETICAAVRAVDNHFAIR